MGKTIVIEEKVFDYISSLYGNCNWQIGLIIGQLSMQRDYVVHFARSPEQSNSSSNGTDMECKPGSVEELDSSWIIEHARQVSRMLTGGLDIAGIFAFGPPDMLSKAQGKIRQVLYSIHKTVFHRPAAYFEDSEACSHSRILLQICSKTKKIICRTINVSDPKATPNPAEVKYQSFVSKWLKLESSFSLRHLHFTVPNQLERSGLQTQVMGSIHSLLHNISAALCTVNGEFASDEKSLALGEKQGKSSQASSKASQPFKVDIYIEQPKGKLKPEEREAIGTFSINGFMSCRAYVNQKATVGDALHAIKYDAVRSILSRFEVLFEDIVDNQKNTNDETFSSTWTSPKRVFACLGDGPITVCDYMFKDETLQDCRERMSELLNISPRDEDLESAEVFPDVHTVKSLIEEMETDSKQNKMKNVEAEEAQLQDGFGRRVIGAFVGVLMAIAAAGITFLWGNHTEPGSTS